MKMRSTAVHCWLRFRRIIVASLAAERNLFFFRMCRGAAFFNLLASLLGGVLMFLLLYFVARWATATDPQILRLLLRAAKLRSQYDPAKFTPVSVVRERRC